ncbi:MAG: ankyrin repeat domain-containing protein [Chitinophagaceae bacterium]|jgi:peptide-methionine (S)-S-oxide reductase|nr:MAG: ankyrin repeat domain-containing protein [Chitinophagaceae bacterium]HEX2847907.1 ankyrin repeat domain-containing protein [Chitinophagaceae bacterium]
MHDLQIVFEEAVRDIDNGDIKHLEQLIEGNPGLLNERYTAPADGYFKHPYLLWFIANNPIREKESLPGNIVEITAMLIRKAKEQGVSTLPYQIEYTLALVVSGRIPKEMGVQIQLADLLISEGAKPKGTIGALAHNNVDIACYLTGKGEPVELITAVCLDLPEAKEMAIKASEPEKELALVGAAFYGLLPALKMLISLGANVNAYPDRKRSKGFHSHATALHQAVFSGSLDAVRLLVEGGARLDLPDRVYQGTPLGWAEYGLMEEKNEEERIKKEAIVNYLKSKSV